MTTEPEELDTYAKGVEAGEKLLGTCGSLASIGEEYEELQLDTHFCAGLDDTAICCTACDWWCEPSEVNDSGECKDCSGEQEHDE